MSGAAHFVILSGEKRRMFKETLIQSQNQISYGFLYIVSSTFSLNSSKWLI